MCDLRFSDAVMCLRLSVTNLLPSILVRFFECFQLTVFSAGELTQRNFHHVLGLQDAQTRSILIGLVAGCPASSASSNTGIDAEDT